jgi:hemolysin activation/secretion protein
MSAIRRSATSALLLALCLVAGAAAAQGPRPSEERPELPEFPPEEAEPERLPPIPVLPEPERDLSAGRRMRVEKFQVRGSSVFGNEVFARITAPYEGREIGTAELAQVRNAITRLYVEAGYVTSGAVIPDQRVTDGVIVVEVIEGTLDDISIESTGRLRPSYVRSRLERGAAAPVNVYALEKQLQLLHRKPFIHRIDAQLTPGARRGASTLGVVVEETRPYRLAIGASNGQSPTVGSEGGYSRVQYMNALGWGDTFSARFELTEGYEDLDFYYSLPLNARDTTLVLNYRYTEGEVVENPFDDLDIESVAQTVGATVRHPLLLELDRELWLGITGEYRTSETDWAFGDFPSIPGSDDGEVDISVVRLFQEWTSRSRTRVLAARSMFSFGLDLFGATTNSGSVPDGRYAAWLAQLQFVQRLPPSLLDSQLVVRGDLQLATDPLLSLEQFSLGGMDTVRGYRENELVRDNGYDASVELRVPVLKNLLPGDVLELAPFFDVGRAWNDKRNAGPKTLASLGLGLRYQLRDRVLAEVYWGGRLRHVKRRGNDIQNNGWHFNVDVALW